MTPKEDEMDHMFLALFYGGMFLASALYISIPILMHIRYELRQIRRAMERLELVKPD